MNKNLKTLSYNISDLTISMIDIARCMGYNDEALEAPYLSIALEMIEKVKPRCDIRGGYVIYDNIRFDKEACALKADTSTFFIEKVVYHQIKKSEQVAFFACTAGKGIDELSRRLMGQGELIEGYMVDTIGTIIVETAMDKIQQSLAAEMKEKQLKTTNRYSPGYCNWDVAEQHKLFQLFPEDFCGISLTEGALMNPVKSVSGIIGIGKEVRFNQYTCNFCDLVDCVHRNKKFHSTI